MSILRERYRIHKGRVLSPDFANVVGRGAIISTSGIVQSDLDDFPPAAPDNLHGTVLDRYSIHNGSSGEIECYLGGRFPNAQWAAGQWDNAAVGNDFADDTAHAQSAAANDFRLGPDASVSANDGHVILGLRPFDVIVYAMQTASAGGSPAHQLQYWNGLAWVVVPNVLSTPSLIGGSTAQEAVVFVRPIDWTATTAAAPGEGIAADRYAIRVQYTGAPASWGIADQVFVGSWRLAVHALAAGGERHESGLATPLSSMDEAPWFVLDSPADADTTIGVTASLERSSYVGVIGA